MGPKKVPPIQVRSRHPCYRESVRPEDSWTGVKGVDTYFVSWGSTRHHKPLIWSLGGNESPT